MLNKTLARACLAAALVSAAPAMAFDIELAGRKLTLEPPQGYCALEQTNPRDKSYLDRLSLSLGEEHQLLLMFVDCEELKGWRARKAERFQRFGQITAVRDLGPDRKGAPIAAIAGLSRNQFTEAVAVAAPRLTDAQVRAAAIAALAQDVAERKPIANRLLGLIERDGAAAYFATVAALDAGSDRLVMAGIFAATLVRGLRLSINLYRPFEGEASYAALLDEQKKIAAALIAKNGETIEPAPALPPEPAPAAPQAAAPAAAENPDASAGGFNWGYLILGAALLIGIGAGLALTLWRQKPGGRR